MNKFYPLFIFFCSIISCSLSSSSSHTKKKPHYMQFFVPIQGPKRQYKAFRSNSFLFTRPCRAYAREYYKFKNKKYSDDYRLAALIYCFKKEIKIIKEVLPLLSKHLCVKDAYSQYYQSFFYTFLSHHQKSTKHFLSTFSILTKRAQRFLENSLSLHNSTSRIPLSLYWLENMIKIITQYQNVFKIFLSKDMFDKKIIFHQKFQKVVVHLSKTTEETKNIAESLLFKVLVRELKMLRGLKEK